MSSFFGSVKRFLQRKDGPSTSAKNEPRNDVARRLVEIIASTQTDECTCEETYALIDQFTDALERGEDVSNLMPLVKRHLEICTDCMEEFEALLRIVQASPAETQGG